MMKAAAPSVGGDRIAPMPGGGEHAAGGVLRIARLAQQRPRDGAERDGRRHAGARHGAEQEAGQRRRPPGPRAAAAERGVRELHEEARRAGVLEHRAVQREQDDVGRRDVERDAEYPLEPHERLPDQAVEAVALVGDAERVRDQPAEVGVREEPDADRRQDPPDRAAGGLEHEHHRDHAGEDVERLRVRRAPEQLVRCHDGVAGRDQREDPERPVQRRRALGGMLGAVRLAARAEHEERQQQYDRKERRPVLLGGDRVQHPVHREQRQPGGQDVDDGGAEARQLAARALSLELFEQPLLGRRVERGCGGRGHPSTARRRWTSPPYSGTRSPPATSVRRPTCVAASDMCSNRAGRAGRSVQRPPRRSRTPSIS